MIDNKKKGIIIGSGVSIATVTVLLLLTTATTGLNYEQQTYEPVTSEVPDGMIYITDYATRDLSIEDLAFESDLIIQGRVIDNKVGSPSPPAEQGMISIPTTNNIVQVISVIKGDPKLVGKTITVETEGSASNKRIVVPEGGSLKKGEVAKLFLAKGVGTSSYVIKGVDQGKYPVDRNNNVKGKFISTPMNAANFDKNIKKILSEPRPERPTHNVNPGDKDFTTAETKAYEDKLRQETQNNKPVNPNTPQSDTTTDTPDNNQIQTHDEEPEERQLQQEQRLQQLREQAQQRQQENNNTG